MLISESRLIKNIDRIHEIFSSATGKVCPITGSSPMSREAVRKAMTAGRQSERTMAHNAVRSRLRFRWVAAGGACLGVASCWCLRDRARCPFFGGELLRRRRDREGVGLVPLSSLAGVRANSGAVVSTRMICRVRRSIRFSRSRSSPPQKAVAMPTAPARPVRPMRWT